MDYYISALNKYSNFKGRTGRKEFWWFVLVNIVVGIALSLFSMLLGDQYRVLNMLYGIFVLLPSIAITVRRLHDTNRSGWWYLIILILFVGIIWFIVLLTLDSTPGDNKYGPNPKGVGAESELTRKDKKRDRIISIATPIVLITILVFFFFFVRNSIFSRLNNVVTQDIARNTTKIGENFFLDYKQLLDIGLNKNVLKESDLILRKDTGLASDNFLLINKQNNDNALVVQVRSGNESNTERIMQMESSLYEQKFSLNDDSFLYKLDDKYIRFLSSSDGMHQQGYFVVLDGTNSYYYRIAIQKKYFDNSFETFKKIAILIAPSVADKFSTDNIVNTKLIKIAIATGGDADNGYVKSAGYYEGNLIFEDTATRKQYHVFLCVKKWPDLKLNSEYILNSTQLSNGLRPNGELAGCYIGDLNMLFNVR